ncbi:MAG: hypothetical protein ACXW6R_16020, partial [Candidatus Binatia bacterium]
PDCTTTKLSRQLAAETQLLVSLEPPFGRERGARNSQLIDRLTVTAVLASMRLRLLLNPVTVPNQSRVDNQTTDQIFCPED